MILFQGGWVRFIFMDSLVLVPKISPLTPKHIYPISQPSCPIHYHPLTNPLHLLYQQSPHHHTQSHLTNPSHSFTLTTPAIDCLERVYSPPKYPQQSKNYIAAFPPPSSSPSPSPPQSPHKQQNTVPRRSFQDTCVCFNFTTHRRTISVA